MSNKYWEKREAEALEHYLEQEIDYKKSLDGIYDRTFDNVKKEIDAFYGRYAKKEGITLAEAKRRVKTADIKGFERKVKRYVKDKNFSKQANEEMRLYNLMMKVNRLEMLKANIGLELISSFDEMEKFMEAILDGRTREELERQAGILGNTIQDNAELAHSIVSASFHNATYSDRIWMYQDLLRDEIGKQLERGLIQGKNPRVLARELNKVFNTGKYNCERLMRTELARVQIESQKQSYEKNGFEMYTFITNTGCCDKCDAIAGKCFYVKDMIPGENAPPMHPNCRCSTAPYSDRKEYDEWLDFISNGGTTEEWRAYRTKNPNLMSFDKDVKVLDLMGKPRIFANERFRIKAYAVDGMDGIFTQTNSNHAQKTIKLINEMESEGMIYDISKIVIAKDLPGVAAYDHLNNILYVNEKLSSTEYINGQLSKGYFVAENIYDVIKHEMFHKKHWDFLKTKGENYDILKKNIESDLHKYVSEQQSYDVRYILKNVSENAEVAFIYCDSLNELIAEVLLQEEKGIVKDEVLLKLVKGCVE